jgi:N-carbamoylputrescine amidase
MVYVAAANRIGFKSIHQYRRNRIFGALTAAGPQGEILAQASHDKEEILIC